MSDSLVIAEVIANLDNFQRELARLSAQVKEYRLMLFETLDNDPDALVD